MDKSKFAISIGHGVGSGKDLSIQSELRLVKIALLYGDVVNLHSPKSEMLLIASEALTKNPTRANIERMARIVGPDQRAQFYRAAELIGEVEEKAKEIKTFPRAKRRAQEKKIEAFMRRAMLKLRAETISTLRPMGFLEFEKLIRLGVLNIEKYESHMSNDNFAEKFTEGVFRIIANNNNFPLLDSEMSQLINLYIKETHAEISRLRKERAAQVQLSAEFISRLPHFEQATVDEIIDIRRMLERPLAKFRSAMVDFSKNIQASAWDADFTFEADELYISKVAPAIGEIEESISSNRIVQNIYQKALINTATAGTLTLAVSNWILPDDLNKSVSNLTGAALGLGSVALGEYFQERRKAEQNQMYFLYKANRLMR